MEVSSILNWVIAISLIGMVFGYFVLVLSTLTMTRFGGAGKRGNSLHLLLIHDGTDIPQRGM
jgi:hypothetical protein